MDQIDQWKSDHLCIPLHTLPLVFLLNNKDKLANIGIRYKNGHLHIGGNSYNSQNQMQ